MCSAAHDRSHERPAARRPPPAARRIPSLDGFRALSIALVLGNHILIGSQSEYLFVFWNGNLGVRVFFVISGFLITALLLAEREKTGRIDLRRFYVRRAFRILPVVVAYLGVVSLMTASGLIFFSATEILSALLFVRDWASGGHVGHFWSLSVEEQFYIFWPSLVALALAVWRRAFPVAAALLLAAPLYRVADYVIGLPGDLLPNVDALMMGALLAMARHRVPEAVARITAVQPVLGRLAAFVFMFAAGIPSHLLVWGPVTVPLTWTVQAFCATYLIASYTTVERGWGFGLLNLRPVMWIGVLSYSLYIWQELFIFPPDLSTPWGRLMPEALPLRMTLMFGAACGSYYLVEKPMLRVRERLERRPVGPAAAVARAQSVSQPIE